MYSCYCGQCGDCQLNGIDSKPQPDQTEREKFEKWFNKERETVHKYVSVYDESLAVYADPFVNMLWQAWQARAKEDE